MKTNLKILAVATGLAISTCAYAQEGFIRPELSYNFGKLSVTGVTGIDLKDAVGFGVAGGTTFGAQNEHEVGLSIAVLEFSSTSSIAGANVSGKVKTVPVLANYRYYFGAKDNAVRFYLAPSLGYTNAKTDIRITNATTITTVRSSGTDFTLTWGAGFGVLYKVADRVDTDVGYRYQKITESNAIVKVGTVYAGVNFRF